MGLSQELTQPEWVEQLLESMGPVEPFPGDTEPDFTVGWQEPVDFTLIEGTLEEQAEDLLGKLDQVCGPRESSRARKEFGECGCRSCRKRWLMVFQGRLAKYNRKLPGSKLHLPEEPMTAQLPDEITRKWVKDFCEFNPTGARHEGGPSTSTPDTTAPAAEPRGGNQ